MSSVLILLRRLASVTAKHFCLLAKVPSENSVSCEVVPLISLKITERGLYNPVKGTITCMHCDGCIERLEVEGAKAIFTLEGYDNRTSLYQDLLRWCAGHLSTDSISRPSAELEALQVGNG
jgi:hypothetical protein